MGRTILITGAGSGIGLATSHRLRRAGHHVIGVDLLGSEIEADLAEPAGRSRMVEEASRLVPEGLDGVIAGAGVTAPDNPGLMVAVNFFGAVATLVGLRPLLARSSRPRAVLIASTAAFGPTVPVVVESCLKDDEAQAKIIASQAGANVYGSTKAAAAIWLRQQAVDPAWAGAGIALNGVGPGLVRTPMTEPFLGNEAARARLAKRTPRAVARCAEPEDLAEVLDFLVNMETTYLLGQVIFVDGGTDALVRKHQF